MRLSHYKYTPHCHCEEQSDEAIQSLDCFATLGPKFKSRAALAGDVLLILMGLWILVEQLL